MLSLDFSQLVKDREVMAEIIRFRNYSTHRSGNYKFRYTERIVSIDFTGTAYSAATVQYNDLCDDSGGATSVNASQIESSKRGQFFIGRFMNVNYQISNLAVAGNINMYASNFRKGKSIQSGYYGRFSAGVIGDFLTQHPGFDCVIANVVRVAPELAVSGIEGIAEIRIQGFVISPQE